MIEDLIKTLQEGTADTAGRRTLYDSITQGQIAAAAQPSYGGGRGRNRGGGNGGFSGGGGAVGGGKFKGGNPAFASPEQIKNAIAIAQQGRSMGASRRDIVTALTTSLVESNLINVNYGDRDSIGLFQQRDAWGPHNVRLNPRKSAAMFFRGGRAGQQGLFDIKGRNKNPIGVNAQDVQVSAYPDRYGERVDEARRIMQFITRGAINRRARRNR